MTPSNTLYNRILWDSRFDPARWVLGVEVRASALKKVRLVDFVPGGDLPWHRVQTFEADGVVVWDRRSGLDRIRDSEVGRAPAGGLLPTGLSVRPVLRWDGAAWTATHTREGLQDSGQTDLLTWNVLFDRYDEGQLHTEARRPLLAAELQRQVADGVDVIALQELQWPLLKRLMAAEWLRRDFALVLTGPPRDVRSHGLALLVRTPVAAAGFVGLGHHKGLLVARVRQSTGPLLVMTTHLSSDHSKDASGRRAAELADIRRIIDATELPVVLLGDLNDESPTPPTALGLRDLAVDHPRFLRRPTFDPSTNPLALENSRTSAPLRLDRFLARPNWRGAVPRLIGTHPTETGLHPSDHYGVRMVVAPRPTTSQGPRLDIAPVHHTALCWVLPDHLAQTVDPIRRHHDPAADRWPAHVNLRFPFVPEHHFEAAAELLRTALNQPAIPVKLDTIGRFGGRRPTLWLDPTTAAPPAWTTLEKAIAPLFPQCPPGRPHLTVARSDAAQEPMVRLAQQAQDGLLSGLHLASRREGGSMEVRGTVALDGTAVTWHDPPGPRMVVASQDGRLVEQIEQQITAAVLHLGGRLHRVGSWAVGVAVPGSDLDLVAVHPEIVSPAELQATVAAALPDLNHIRAVVGARVPGLQLKVATLDVDIACVGVPAALVDRAVAIRHTFDEPRQRALAGISDADVLAIALQSHEARTLARTVKTWAAARGLDQRPLGGLPALGWLVLVADAVRTANEAILQDQNRMLVHFFEHHAEQLPHTPVALQSGWVGAPHLPLQISVPAAPLRACSDAVTPAMAQLIEDELLRGFVLADRHAPLSELAAPPPWHRRHAATALLSVTRLSSRELEGRLRGRVRALLQIIEDNGIKGIHAIPHPRGVRIGLGHAPPTLDQLHHWATR